ncbi:hypothetical protein [Pseudomonas putida]|uniref:hypothetical protein n=1 Tax=Pseudomonas putida TaxID=303 RepID=UPI000750E29D|nr:hypothetical protein [Pseudomonas putida]
MKAVVGLSAAFGAAVLLAGCSAIQDRPYSPAPEGVSIVQNQYGSYSVERVQLTKPGMSSNTEAMQFCFGQNVPGINGPALFNTSKTKITAQGKDQVTFIVPMTMGTPLAYDLMFAITVSSSQQRTLFDFTNLKIRGTWSANEVYLPGSAEAAQYVDSARAKLDSISSAISSCLLAEG